MARVVSEPIPVQTFPPPVDLGLMATAIEKFAARPEAEPAVVAELWRIFAAAIRAAAWPQRVSPPVPCPACTAVLTDPAIRCGAHATAPRSALRETGARWIPASTPPAHLVGDESDGAIVIVAEPGGCVPQPLVDEARRRYRAVYVASRVSA